LDVTVTSEDAIYRRVSCIGIVNCECGGISLNQSWLQNSNLVTEWRNRNL